MIALLTLALLGPAVSSATPPTDPFLEQYAKTRRFMAGRPVGAQATADGRTVLFLRSAEDSPVQSLHAFDVETGQTRELLTAETLLGGSKQVLSDEERAALERMRISARGFTSFQLSQDGTKVLVGLSGSLYVVELASGTSKKLKAGPAPFDPRFSPDGKHVAYVRDNDVFAVDLGTNRERRITRGGSELVTHGLAEFVAQEEMSRFSGFWWSPDSKTIAFAEADSRPLERLSIVDPLRPEAGAQTVPYPRAGKANAIVRLGLTPASGKGKVTWVDWDAKAFPYLATVKWPEKAPLTLVVQNREQTQEQVLAVDPARGRTRTLLTESDDAWINLDQAFPQWLPDGKGFFWFTERNGAPEVELRGADGALVSSWVKPEAGFDAMVGYDGETRTLVVHRPAQSHADRALQGGGGGRAAEGRHAAEGRGLAPRAALRQGEGPRGDRELAEPDAAHLGAGRPPVAPPGASCPRSPASRHSPCARACRRWGRARASGRPSSAPRTSCPARSCRWWWTCTAARATCT